MKNSTDKRNDYNKTPGNRSVVVCQFSYRPSKTANGCCPPPRMSYYYLRVRSNDIRVAISINDYLILTDDEAEGVVTDQSINEWIQQGENGVKVALSWKDSQPFEAGKASFEMDVFLHDQNEDIPTPAKSYVQFQYPFPGEPESYPFNRSFRFQIEEDLGTTLWKEAAILQQISDPDRTEIINLIKELDDFLKAKDADKAFELQKYKFEDIARAEHKGPQFFEMQKKQLEWMLSQPGITNNPWDAPSLKMDLVGGGRLVLVTMLNGKSPISLDVKGNCFEIPVRVAKFGSQWRFAR